MKIITIITKLRIRIRIYVSEGIDVNRTNAYKECIMCHYLYFLDQRFTFQLCICHGCHIVLIMSINIDNIAIFNICGAAYRCIINGISQSKAINVLKMLI